MAHLSFLIVARRLLRCESIQLWCYVSTTWPSGLLLIMVICSLCRTLEEMQDDAVTSGNNVFFVFFELCIWNAKWSGDDEHGCSAFRGL